MILSLVRLLGGAVIDGVRDWQQSKSEARKEQHEIRKARVSATIKRIHDGDEHAAELDQLSMSQRGYKDDLLMYIVVTPCVLAFFPETQEFVTEGFESLQEMPEWYLIALVLVFVDTFGFRRLLRGALEGYLKQRYGNARNKN